MSHFRVGQRVYSHAEGNNGTVVGVARIKIDGDNEEADVYAVNLEGGSILPFFEGDIELVLPDTHTVKVAYVFTANVEAFSEYDAEQALRNTLVETLTWDGDDDAPKALEELQMRSIDVPAEVPA